MRTNGAFDRPRPGDRLRARWYGMSRAARVNKLLFLAAGISLVAFVNVANRGPGPSTGLSAGTVPRPTVGALPSSTLLRTAGIATDETSVLPPAPSTTSSALKPVATTRRTTTTAAPARTPAPPATTGDPGVVFSTVPSTTVPPTTAAPTTAPPGTTTTSAPTTTALPPSSTTTTTVQRSVLQILFGG